MAFHNVRLPTDVERGAEGGPSFKTDIFPLSSGHEKRNIGWERERGEWNIGYGIDNKAAFTTVINFFRTRYGKAHSFRFKDWSDFEISRQSIGSTDTSTSTFQLFKRYSSGVTNFDRPLEKPTATGALAWVNSVSQVVVYDVAPAATEVAINTLTGIITIGSTHVATTGFSIELKLEFDVPVRFNVDKLNVNMLTFDAGSIPNIPVIEVRGE